MWPLRLSVLAVPPTQPTRQDLVQVRELHALDLKYQECRLAHFLRLAEHAMVEKAVPEPERCTLLFAAHDPPPRPTQGR